MIILLTLLGRIKVIFEGGFSADFVDDFPDIFHNIRVEFIEQDGHSGPFIAGILGQFGLAQFTHQIRGAIPLEIRMDIWYLKYSEIS